MAKGGLGRSLSQDRRRTGRLVPILQQARFDKAARLLGQFAGVVYLPLSAEWLATYLSKLLPPGLAQRSVRIDHDQPGPPVVDRAEEAQSILRPKSLGDRQSQR